jgi:hypothetical protein
MHAHDASRRSPRTLGGFGNGPALVPACRCAGRCRCGGLVPALLLERLERDCEFYRSEW